MASLANQPTQKMENVKGNYHADDTPTETEETPYKDFQCEPEVPLPRFIRHIVESIARIKDDSLAMQQNGCGQMMVAATIYLLRLFEAHPELQMTVNNQNRLFLVGLVCADKFFHDRPIANSQWCRLAGFSTSHLNEMEREFLRLLDYKLHIEDTDIVDFVHAHVYNV